MNKYEGVYVSIHARRAMAHAAVSAWRAGRGSQEDAVQAVKAASKTIDESATATRSLSQSLHGFRLEHEGMRSGFIGALRRGQDVRLYPGGHGEPVFRELLLKARQTPQELTASEQRALEIRRHAAAIIEGTENLRFYGSKKGRKRSESRIRSRVGKLLDLGITRDMQKLFPPTELADPVRLAESSAGRLLSILEVRVSEQEIYPGTDKKVTVDFSKTFSKSYSVFPRSLRGNIAA